MHTCGQTLSCGAQPPPPGLQVIELRAVVQRVEEGPAVRVHPRAISVRQVAGLRAFLGGRSSGAGPAGGIITTTGVFPPVSQGEDRFSPRFTVNKGVADTSGGGGSGMAGVMANGGGGDLMGSWLGTAASPAAQSATPPLALYEYATVDFFIEAAGCPTEADFLRLEACVDVAVSGVASGGAAALSVGLTEVNPPPPVAFGLHAMGVELSRPIKRRLS